MNLCCQNRSVKNTVKILVVDDQMAIVDSLKREISWEAIGITKVFTSCSAKEARLVLVNFEIDILLTDIEMPEEDGLELFRWTMERYPDLVGIFLTSHADFSYAKEAIRLGGFDYILQPARYEEVERVLKKAVEKIRHNVRIRKLEKTQGLITDQRDSIVELMLAKEREGKSRENCLIFDRMKKLFAMDFTNSVFWPMWIQIEHFTKVSNQWDEKLIAMVFRNVLEEIFDKEQIKICISDEGLKDYLIFAAADAGSLTSERWEQGLKEFIRFINLHMDFLVAVYPEREAMPSLRMEWIEAIRKRRNANTARKAGIFWEDVEIDGELMVNEERIRAAADYIKKHISRNVTRAEVAKMLHLNEEYFSRLFKKYTGYTFKDYEMIERTEQAKKLLKNSHFSISIIASKVGYDNFSHFSKMFKKMTGQTPQEYRKENS